MDVSTTKSQTKSPINIDALLVCKKKEKSVFRSIEECQEETLIQYNRFVSVFEQNERALSENDKNVIFNSQLIVTLSQLDSEYLTDISTNAINILFRE